MPSPLRSLTTAACLTLLGACGSAADDTSANGSPVVSDAVADEPAIATTGPVPTPTASPTLPPERSAIEEPVGPGGGRPCQPGPSPSAVSDDTVSGIRGEQLVEALTGIDETALAEGEEAVWDDPNYGGVWGDRHGGWVVAVVDCELVDANRLAELAGGPHRLRLIHVPLSFAEVEALSATLLDGLAQNGIAGTVLIDSTLTGRQVVVVVEDPSLVPADFGADSPDGVVTIVQGDAPRED